MSFQYKVYLFYIFLHHWFNFASRNTIKTQSMSSKSETSQKIPSHIAIIMDGNGRWAESRGLDRTFGHQNGVESVREAIKGCRELGVKFLTLYAFSTENWNRPKDEVAFLMGLLVDAIHSEVSALIENDIRLETIGDISMLPEASKIALVEAKARTSNCASMQLNLALNYGSKHEIIQATKSLAEDTLSGKLQLSDIDEDVFSSYLFTKGIPDPEILIRTSNEMRLSNFLLWQLAYAELFFLPIFWPDFRKEHLMKCVTDFQNRERRFGKTSHQINNENQ
jgi:undecaprenyl diphosphate synthase